MPLAGGDRRNVVTEAFVAHCGALLTVAYMMLGSAAVPQKTYLRGAGVNLANVRDQRAYLARIATRRAQTRLRAAAPTRRALA